MDVDENNKETEQLLQSLLQEGNQNQLGEERNNINTQSYSTIDNEVKSENNIEDKNKVLFGGEPHIGHIEETPKYLIDNEYILSGYRINFNTIKRIFKSVNVWTHLLGTICLIFLIFYTVCCIQYGHDKVTMTGIGSLKNASESKSNITNNNLTNIINLTNLKNITNSVDNNLNINSNNVTNSNSVVYKFPIFPQIIGGIICLGFSATFHLFGAMSKFSHEFFSRFDYGGISILIAGSCWPLYYYMFYCNQFLMILYLSLITTFSVGVFLYSLKDDFASPKRRTLRGVLYLILGISAGVPMIHLAFFSKSIGGLEAEISYFYWIFGGVSYIAGASIYILRFPEKCFRGIFDIIGNSHQIFHVGVMIGVAVHYKAAIDAYYYRNINSC